MEIIIYGTGDWGKYAYWSFFKRHPIKFFVDSNNVKWGGTLYGKAIKPPDEILKEPCKVIVAIQKYGNIPEWLREHGIEYCLFDPGEMYMNPKGTIDLRKFLSSFEELKIYQTFMSGGSGFFDYTFIRGIAQKYRLKTYLEIGSYIGESLRCVADICDTLHSVTLPKGALGSLSHYCKENGIPDYSGRLSAISNIVHHYGDSREFDYSSIDAPIDLYFIDGDHSYEGVFTDTKNIFRTRNSNSFVIWHDYKFMNIDCNGAVAPAVRDAIGEEEFKNVYSVSENLCGIYIPHKFQMDFPMQTGDVHSDEKLYYYELMIHPMVNES